MGLVRMGPPVDLLLQLKSQFEIGTFVETGTYYGGTATWASSNFKRVITIESSDLLFEQAKEKLKALPNVTLLKGDSRQLLREIVVGLSSPSMFWLDSHWSGGDTSGELDECPLVEELRVLQNAKQPHLLFIDDARLFLSPPPPPHDPEQWPKISELMTLLNEFHYQKYIVIIEDVIIDVPLNCKQVVLDYCRRVNAELWDQRKKCESDSARSSLFQRIAAKFKL